MPPSEGRFKQDEHAFKRVSEDSETQDPRLDAQQMAIGIEESELPERRVEAPLSTTVIEETEPGELQMEAQPQTTLIQESELGESQLEAVEDPTVIEETELGDPQIEALPSTSGGPRVCKGSQYERLPTTSVVDIIPADCSSPEAAKNVPGSVKRYLQRWPRGSNMGDPGFDNTTVHELKEGTSAAQNNEDAKRRADLLQAVPTHVHVSL